MSVRLLIGDCRERLAELSDESVHCCVTSPPYFGLRDYGVAGQIGLEPSPEAYVAELVAVFREVRRVLRRDGTLWLNLGDSYAGSWGARGRGEHTNAPRPDLIAKYGTAAPARKVFRPGNPEKNGGNSDRDGLGPVHGCKAKDLIGIPWSVAFALRADGWWLRSDIIWAKPNPMPESVTDRPTSAHEHLFLLAKSERYAYDADAVREPYNEASISRYATPMQSTAPTGRQPGGDVERKIREEGIRDPNPLGRNLRNVWTVEEDEHAQFLAWKAARAGERTDVWTVATQPYKESHFATFPPDLIEPCIKAGTSERGVCPTCAAPWVREMERTRDWREGAETAEQAYGPGSGNRRVRPSNGGMSRSEYRNSGWSPTCGCGGDPVPATVLDCFGGAGTTGLVADRLGRSAILIELNPEYASMGENRIRNDAPLFAEVAAG